MSLANICNVSISYVLSSYFYFSIERVVWLVAWENCRTGACLLCLRNTGILPAWNPGIQIWSLWRHSTSCAWGSACTALSINIKDTVQRKDGFSTEKKIYRSCPKCLQFSWKFQLSTYFGFLIHIFVT